MHLRTYGFAMSYIVLMLMWYHTCLLVMCLRIR